MTMTKTKSNRGSSLRRRLPYGVWCDAAGREVLFNRDYQPLWNRSPNGVVSPADPAEQVEKTDQRWFFTDDNPPWKDKATLALCKDVLAAWGITGDAGDAGRSKATEAR